MVSTIKLGGDTDANACIVGGLAGLFYGINNIPKKLMDDLIRKDNLINLATKWEKSLTKN